MSSQWSKALMPDLSHQRALVTGVTSGLGEQTTLELARKGAEVLMVARNQEKLAAAVEDVSRAVPTAKLRPVIIDLADLSSVRRGAAAASAYGPIDILVNNAGVMATPHRHTADGFELQFGTNHLGHFALTGLLLPQLVAAGDARVVTVSSLMHRFARRVPTTDPRLDSGHYWKWAAYARSKLANLLFAFELDRRASAHDLPLTSVAAHPGYTSTNLINGGLQLTGRNRIGTMFGAATAVVGQPAGMGALPLLMAATMGQLPGGSFLGPGGPGELRGAPRLVGASRSARDEQFASAVWSMSESATGVVYP